MNFIFCKLTSLRGAHGVGRGDGAPLCYSLNRSNFSRFGSRDKIVIQLKTKNKKSSFTSETGSKKQKNTQQKHASGGEGELKGPPSNPKPVSI